MSTTEAGIVSAAVVSLTQLLKWTNLIPDRYGPGSVLVWAALGVLLWAWSLGRLHQAIAFDLFSGWVVVALTAAGIYGFTRAGAAIVTKMAPPPATGAGSEPTAGGDPIAAMAGQIVAMSGTDRAILRVEIDRLRAEDARTIDPATPAGRAALDALDDERRAGGRG
jgi:hypothetical protein